MRLYSRKILRELNYFNKKKEKDFIFYLHVCQDCPEIDKYSGIFVYNDILSLNVI